MLILLKAFRQHLNTDSINDVLVMVIPLKVLVHVEERKLLSTREKISHCSFLVCLKHIFILGTEEKIRKGNVEWKVYFLLKILLLGY